VNNTLVAKPFQIKQQTYSYGGQKKAFYQSNWKNWKFWEAKYDSVHLQSETFFKITFLFLPFILSS